ncbi:MAG TPA: DUF6569 family protein [Chitinophagaceae bacterium]|jgi:ARG/rhodanese/phosphatase superfamily protein|nr:DUF6569 family protein [Chitinophagaceae bacterium]
MKLIAFIALVWPLTVLSQYKLSENYLTYKKNATQEDLKKFTFQNLRLYPIIANDSFKMAFRNLTKFTPLKKALAEKKVIITEKGNGGSVNALVIENRSKDTIIVNCGEVIKGGQQDRVINTDMVLYPNSGKKDLPVFCVEQGRWSPRNESLRNSGTAGAAASFDGYYNFSSMSLRKVVAKESNQLKVWNKVEEINDANKTSTETKTYTALEQSQDYSLNLKKYISFFEPAILAEKEIVGVIVVTGNKVIGADIFATHELFIQNFNGLVHSYATEAIISGKPVTINQATVDKYINDLLGNEKQQEETLKQKGSKFENKGKKIRISSFE